MKTQKIFYRITAALAILALLFGLGILDDRMNQENALVVMTLLFTAALISLIAGKLSGDPDSAAQAT